MTNLSLNQRIHVDIVLNCTNTEVVSKIRDINAVLRAVSLCIIYISIWYRFPVSINILK